MTYLVARALHGCSTTTISSLDIPGSNLKIAAPFGLIMQFCNSENQKPLRKRGAGASIGEIDKGGNHDFDEFNVPYMHENDPRSHPTPLGLIPQSPSEYRGFRTANLEAQGEVA